METFFNFEAYLPSERIESSHNIHVFRKCFCIDFEFNHTIVPSQSDATTFMPDFTTTIKRVVAIPIEILCNGLEGDHNGVLYAEFSFVPDDLLYTVLPNLEEFARQIVAHNYENRDILELNVRLSAITSIEEEEEDFRNQDDYGQAQQVVDLMEKLENCYPFSDSIEQCPICLEEFCIKSDLARTKCSHVFHKNCIGSWIQQCINRSSTYTCPLCRGLL
ncbi:unnamed protein product [Lathyrus oleraceus]